MKVGDIVVNKAGAFGKITDDSVYNLVKVEFFDNLWNFFHENTRMPCEQFRLASPEEIAGIIAEKMLK